MSLKPTRPPVVFVSKVDKLEKTIKLLEKENSDLRSDLGKLTLEKENLKFNLNKKRERVFKSVEEVQVEQNKRRKVGDVMKGTYESLSSKKKQLTKA